MDCDRFKEWLEKRDLSDQSEYDQALKHKNICNSCSDIATKDEMLDKKIRQGLTREPLPDHLEKIIALNLGTGAHGRRKLPTGLIKTLSAISGVVVLTLFYLLWMPKDYSTRIDFAKAVAENHLEITAELALDRTDNISAWLAAHAGFEAIIPEQIKERELPLVGIRICSIGVCRTVHLVYRDGAKLMSLYIAKATTVSAPLDKSRMYRLSEGNLNVRMWREHNQVYVVVV